MGMRADIGVATLAFVTRVVNGDIAAERTVFNKDTKENEKVASLIEDPVIIFFPTRACLVMPAKEAERMGYLQQPTILNLEAVTNTDTIAGKFKFSINEDERRNCWKMLEDSLIASCTARGGYALPQGAMIDDRSFHLYGMKKAEKEIVNAN